MRYPPLTDKDLARFWRKVDKSAEGGCWLWTAHCNAGYAALSIKLPCGRWTNAYAHILSFDLAGGVVGDDEKIGHTCPNAHCVNPAHLVAVRRMMTEEEHRESIRRRFWAKVDKRPGFGPEGDCWVWIGAKFGKYGGIALGRKTKSGWPSLDYAHRVSYTLHIGPVPDGLYVLHRCDNKKCVRPDHLFIGTQQDNVNDAREKGILKIAGMRRRKHKIAPPKAIKVRLPPEQGERLRAARRRRGLSIYDIARVFGVHFTAISRFENGQRGIPIEKANAIFHYVGAAMDAAACNTYEFGPLKLKAAA